MDQNEENSAGGQQPLRRNRIRHRKRFKHVKRHTTPVGSANKSEASTKTSTPTPSHVHVADATSELEDIELEFVESPRSSPSDHDYCRPSSSMSSRPGSSLSATHSVSLTDFCEDSLMSDSSSGFLSPTLGFTPISSASPCPQTPNKDALDNPISPPLLPPPMAPPPQPHSSASEIPALPQHVIDKLLLEVRSKLILMLPHYFWPIVDTKGIPVLMVGRRESKAVQRSIFISPSGLMKFEVHGQEYPAHTVLHDVAPQRPLSEENLGYFTDRIVKVVSNFRILEICAGMNKEEFKEVWSVTPGGVIDSDTFKECRYKETFRSKNCSLLVEARNWRCRECTKLQPYLKRKLDAMKKEEPHQHTNIRFLLDKQKNFLLAQKQKVIKKQGLMIDRLQARMKQLLTQEGVKVEKSLSDDLTEILQSSNLSPVQSLFLQQQLKAIKCKKSCGMRWHPTLIRLALSIYLKSPAAYKELQESGFIKLPTARTLFDYTHATRIEQGVDTSVLESVAKQVEELEATHKHNHVVMADEIHVSKNLVVQKSTGEIIGFTNLDELDQEVKLLDSYLDDPDKVVEPEIATKIMAFMVRGVSSKVKDVIASYPVCNPSPKQMYLWTWDVIGALERSGMRVIAFICDGAPSNRAFIKLHKPVTDVPSGAIFDTINKYAPHRTLYFFSDVPHLIKTIRNALFNSRLGKKGTRLLKKNGEPMVWDTIIRLYQEERDDTFRKSYKLTAQSVYPDSYSRMKVRPAAVVLSKTVSNDIKSKQWAKTTELVEFLLKTNNWFDLLNGAFSSQGVKTNNRRLDPYTQKDIDDFEQNVPDSRFKELFDYLDYLDEWRQDVAMRKQHAADGSVMSELGVEALDGDTSFHALEESQHEDQFEGSKNLLPHQTQLGIEISTRAFMGAVRYLIKNGVTFINARVFQQDPLEQNCGKQRMGGGGSNNPNVAQYFFKQRNISTIGQLAYTKRKSSGNTEVVNEDNENSIDSAPC